MLRAILRYCYAAAVKKEGELSAQIERIAEKLKQLRKVDPDEYQLWYENWLDKNIAAARP